MRFDRRPGAALGLLVAVCALAAATATTDGVEVTTELFIDGEEQTTSEAWTSATTTLPPVKQHLLVASHNSNVTAKPLPSSAYSPRRKTSWLGSRPRTTFTPAIARPRILSRVSGDALGCRRHAVSTCISVANQTCLGLSFPYDSASFEQSGLQRLSEVHSELNQFLVLRTVPKCWELLHPMLCAFYFPRCSLDEKGNASVELAKAQLCKLVNGPCRIAEQLLRDGWPHFLACNDSEALRQPFCEGDSDISLMISAQQRANASPAFCTYPLVPVDAREGFHDFDGCAMRCQDPLFRKEEYDYMNTLMKVVSVVGCGGFGFIILTCLASCSCCAGSLDYTRVINNNVCFGWFAIMFGFLVQFLPGVELSVTCSQDGTKRSPASPGEGYQLCLLVLFFLYSGFIKVCYWSVISVLWLNRQFVLPRSGQQVATYMAKKHFVIQTTGIVLPAIVGFIVSVFTSLFEADSLMGVCFVSQSPHAFGISVLIPLVVTISLCTLLSIQPLLFFTRVLKQQPRNAEASNGINNSDNNNARKVTKFTILPLLISLILKISCIAVVAFFSVKSMVESHDQEQSLIEFTICKARQSISTADNCPVGDKPSMTSRIVLMLFVCAVAVEAFLKGCRSSEFRAWKRLCNRLCSLNEAQQSEKRTAEISLNKLDLGASKQSSTAADDGGRQRSLSVDSQSVASLRSNQSIRYSSMQSLRESVLDYLAKEYNIPRGQPHKNRMSSFKERFGNSKWRAAKTKMARRQSSFSSLDAPSSRAASDISVISPSILDELQKVGPMSDEQLKRLQCLLEAGTSKSFTTASVQTSDTFLSSGRQADGRQGGAAPSLGLASVATQTGSCSTTSSSQTESYPLEPNVIRISVSGQTSSSDNSVSVTQPLKDISNLAVAHSSTPSRFTVPPRPSRHRERRGAMVEEDARRN